MAVQYKDYYKVLGVSKTASQSEIRKAFRALARQHHPDVSKDKKGAEAAFTDLNEAYEVLGDEEKRKKYDELGQEWAHRGAGGMPQGNWGAGGGGNGFSDFFEAFFGGNQFGGGQFGGGFGPRGRGHRPPPAASMARDIEGDVQVTIEEILSGTRKRVRVQRGSGPAESMEVGIPKGVCAGQKVRVAGKGEGGGDVLLKVVIAQHPKYRVEGEDLVSEVTVPVWMAVLGGEAEVETPEGSVRLKVPAGTQPGRRMRIKERGLPTRQKGRGDFYVQIGVSLPENLGPREREIWEQIRTMA
jgi:curved DNA-binding protein